MSKEPDELIQTYLSGQGTESEVSDLEELILTDPEIRSEFLRHSRMDAALASSAQAPLLQVKNDPTGYGHRPNPVQSWRNPSFIGIAVLAAVLVIFAGMLLPRAQGVKCEVLFSSGRAAEEYVVGQVVRIQRLRLMQGDLKIRLDSGVTLNFTGPNETQFVSSMHLRLKTGSITADVGARGKGFVIETPNTRIVDLGTRFGVSLHDSGETDVVVMKGEVEVFQSKGSDKQIARLAEGNAIRIDSKWVARRLAAVALSGKSLAILDGKATRDAIVTDVSDNIREADFHRFYSISPGGMKPGSRAYSTLGKPRWQAMPDQTFPADMLGADIVGTFSEDRFDADLHLTIQIARPATVYVMFDTRSKVPGWLQRDFEKTDHQLRCGPWGVSGAAKKLTPSEDGNRYVTYQVWRKDCADSAPVKLGPPYAADKPQHLAMYGIAVKGTN